MHLKFDSISAFNQHSNKRVLLANHVFLGKHVTLCKHGNIIQMDTLPVYVTLFHQSKDT